VYRVKLPTSTNSPSQSPPTRSPSRRAARRPRPRRVAAARSSWPTP
jgi:hypothetical protein